MKLLNTLAENNKLLSSPEKLAVYMILYIAQSRGETLTINDITKKINKKYECDVDYQKTRNVLLTLEEKNIVKKTSNNDFKGIKYELNNIIYVPFNQTPIPSYQLMFLVFSTIISSYILLFVENTMYLIVTMSSFFTVLTIIIFHYTAFELSQRNISVDFKVKIHINNVLEYCKLKYEDMISS